MTNGIDQTAAQRAAYIKEIEETCALASKPDWAKSMIERGLSPAQARSELLGNRFDIVADMKRRHGMN